MGINNMKEKSKCCNADVYSEYGYSNIYCSKCRERCSAIPTTDEGKDTNCKGCGRISTVVDLYSSCPFCAAIPPESWEDTFRKTFYVYNLVKGSPAGAEKEAIAFISQTLATEKAKWMKEWREKIKSKRRDSPAEDDWEDGLKFGVNNLVDDLLADLTPSEQEER